MFKSRHLLVLRLCTVIEFSEAQFPPQRKRDNDCLVADLRQEYGNAANMVTVIDP